jgi:hypothetical protein
MLQNTPPESYPVIRLPIKGVRGACGSVYNQHGVLFDGVGSDEYILSDGTKISGILGQTGADSSMFKWFDLFCGDKTKETKNNNNNQQQKSGEAHVIQAPMTVHSLIVPVL